ncbi:MAG: hypothetical protein A2504_14920 [Bdellovibrionales bacterium RIFOXYD12_FULL_39_22]|nr:MAG: hypothetical protein A2385_10385 [Bdellovibrionales bacterium RIFOXYB1_FULL_39_21]OFZ40868.1 MAG: hypothetical protein A2485_17545 [Bdellovibrionales bacterium RIFOXYC12_FULL_39_17]OFZ44409.1 MAG: hypothetical protein A2404_11155 [Bdellovibrionales bacterium RIFOXYC1_FULL_39_130]OFZ74156.1 MAG: hypothetical protein A2560_03820 [Bdellovibrionales bacterium RIFOXYD1_FULL_39_84]OFZ92005.1 MAG: hypothetical protein A2504_14920 [Bdellovibrionales bacterium RIFOXYD12_FULL_39_22]HLE12324.1 DU
MGHNRLKHEKSLYLRQHADNPIHWWPYGPEALQKAQDDKLPIFLSIGYSACHWCHVMATESFADQEIAEIINKHFVAIKIDREEYPEIDNYYQKACHLYSHNTGWPLSAFLLPDMRPFFVGTYFPAIAKQKETTFGELLAEILRVYKGDHPKVLENAQKVFEAITNEGYQPEEKVDFKGHFPSPMAIMDAIKKFQDETNGGYGMAPKFPNFAFYEWAVEQILEGIIDKTHGVHIVKTVETMLMGGIYDHARGGIHRYTTDAAWQIPHFEKMLYDQAGLLRLLSKISLIFPSPLVYDALINTLDYLQNEMFDEDRGYFFSNQSADSEGIEGLYFTFSEEEFEDAMNNSPDNQEDFLNKNMEKIKRWHKISEKGNFHSKLNIISLDWKHREEFFTADGWTLVRKTRQALAHARKGRLPPKTDTKGVAGHNFLIMSALCDVIQYCKIDAIKKMARTIFDQAADKLDNNFLVNGETINHVTTIERGIPYVEDYIFYADYQLRAYELTGEDQYKSRVFSIIKHILNKYLAEDNCFTRPVELSGHENYPNQRLHSFDNSYRSPLSVLLFLARKSALLFNAPELTSQSESLFERTTHACLKNPLNSGEALRTFTYPDDAFKVLSIPKTWLKQETFLNFLTYFLPRFVFNYHENKEGDRWQICGQSKCELQGDGLDSFIKALVPAK